MALVQPIVVLPGTHEDTVVAVAQAACSCYLQRSDRRTVWSEWMAGSFTKSVRRVKRASDFERILALPGGVEFTQGEARAVAFPPMEVFPDPIRQLQVSGLDAERTGVWHSTYRQGQPCLAVNSDITMSTGKTAAQVAHALVLWASTQPAQVIDLWLAGRGLAVLEWPFSLAGLPAADAVLTIEDNGHTEVVPGTVTVKAWTAAPSRPHSCWS